MVRATLNRRNELQQQMLRAARQFSSSQPGQQKPAFQIPAHVATFSILLMPVLAYTLFYQRTGDQDALEQEIRDRYGPEVRLNAEKNKAMGELFQRTIRNPDGSADSKLDEMLKGGAGGKKRMYAVDEKLYGTKEGVKERQRTEEEIKKQKEERKKRKKEKKALAASQPKSNDSKSADKEAVMTSQKVISADVPVDADSSAVGNNTRKADLATVAGITVMAAAGGYLAGVILSGKRS
jgi:hypothetical protein